MVLRRNAADYARLKAACAAAGRPPTRGRGPAGFTPAGRGAGTAPLPKKTQLSIIAAIGENGVIGREGDLPWRLPADLARFKRLTMGHHLLMGRRTWESIGRPLPGRTTVVLTRGEIEVPEGVLVARSLAEARALAEERGDDEAFVAGGAGVYRSTLPEADRLYLTRVLARVEGDVRFPELDPAAWDLVSSEERAADATNPYPLRFEEYRRAGC